MYLENFRDEFPNIGSYLYNERVEPIKEFIANYNLYAQALRQIDIDLEYRISRFVIKLERAIKLQTPLSDLICTFQRLHEEVMLNIK